MRFSHPHTQTIVISIACLIAVGGTAFYVFGQPTMTTSSQSAYTSVNNATSSFVSEGNNDWQKDFYATTGSSSLGSVRKLTSSQSNQPLTLTDKLSRDFFARYIQLQQNNLGDNQQLVADNINQTIDTTVQSADKAVVYTFKNIVLSQDSSTASIRAYGNAVGDIFGKYAPTTNPADIATEAFDKNDMSILSKIDPIIAAGKKILGLLKATPVPQPLAQDHLDLINGVSMMLYVSEGLRNIEGDPMQSIVALSQYTKAQDALRTPFINLQTYFKNNSVTFTAQESGRLFAAIAP